MRPAGRKSSGLCSLTLVSPKSVPRRLQSVRVLVSVGDRPLELRSLILWGWGVFLQEKTGRPTPVWNTCMQSFPLQQSCPCVVRAFVFVTLPLQLTKPVAVRINLIRRRKLIWLCVLTNLYGACTIQNRDLSTRRPVNFENSSCPRVLFSDRNPTDVGKNHGDP